MATKQDKAVVAANALIGLAGQFQALYQAAVAFNSVYNSEGYSTTWGNFPTAAQATDGSLGAADATPTAGHPIDIRVANVAALAKAVPASQLTSMVTALQQFINYCTSVAVITGNYNQSINDLAS